MLSGLEKKVADFIKANELFADAERVLLAVSGGADSIALLHVIMTLKTRGLLRAKLCCAHINHMLRAQQSDKDEEFVLAQAAKFQLTVIARRIDVREFARKNKMSIETAARKMRMKNLIEIAGENKCSHVVTGHQKDDNAETLLHRMLRGTGFRGLGGIWPLRMFDGNISFVRPLLCVDRQEIVKYLLQNKLNWREDLTNADCRYTRNYIRHRLLPALQEDFNGSIVGNLYDLSVAARKFYKNVCNSANKIWPGISDCTNEEVVLNLELFSEQSRPIQVELIRRSLTFIGCGERNLTQKLHHKILQLAKENVIGRKIHLPGGFLAARNYDTLIFARRGKACGVEFNPLISTKAESIVIKIPGRTQFSQYLIESEITELDELECDKLKAGKIKMIECFDMDKITPPLRVRLRRTGDRFSPLGRKGVKKLGKFLTAQKVPHNIRQKVIVVTDKEKIIWLWPVRISEQVKITDETREILRLKIIENDLVE